MSILDLKSPFKSSETYVPKRTDDDMLKENYLKMLADQYEYKPSAGLGDVVMEGVGGAKKGYEWAKGGSKGVLGTLKGIGGGILGGIGYSLPKALEFANTSTGRNIIAGSVANPYLAQGYLQGAKEIEAKEQAEKSVGMAMNKEKMAEMGAMIREKEKALSEEKIAEQNRLSEEKIAEANRQVQEEILKQNLAAEAKKSGESKETAYNKMLIDTASDMYKKGKLSEEDYNKYVANPQLYTIEGSGWGLRKLVPNKKLILEELRQRGVAIG